MVETQGAVGWVPLSPEAIAAADAVIIAADVQIRDRERFTGKPVVTVGVRRAITDAPGLLDQAVAAARRRHRHACSRRRRRLPPDGRRRGASGPVGAGGERRAGRRPP